MFEDIFNGISEFFSDILPDEFCLPCFLKGVAEGFIIGVATLAVIAAAPAWLAVALTVGLIGFGIYGAVQLCSSWKSMSGAEKSEALGGIVGGMLAGRFGPKIPPRPFPMPGVQYLTTPGGQLVPVLVVTEVTATIPATGVSAVAGTGGAMMMASGGDPGKTGETSSTKTGKRVHKERADQRRASGDFDEVNSPIKDKDGNAIKVPKRVDLETGDPQPGTKMQDAMPDAVDYDKGLIVDDKPAGRPLAKDRQEIIRFIKAYEAREGKLPETIEIHRYDPTTGAPAGVETFKPEDFLPKGKSD